MGLEQVPGEPDGIMDEMFADQLVALGLDMMEAVDDAGVHEIMAEMGPELRARAVRQYARFASIGATVQGEMGEVIT